MDEPTSALDHKIKDKLYKMIEYMKKQGTSVIMISHDQKLINKSDRIIEMENGKIIRDSSGYSKF